jgi:hypothetical protein
MFVENYRRENAESIMAGGESSPPPYPRISDEGWRVWSTFLPGLTRTAHCQPQDVDAGTVD